MMQDKTDDRTSRDTIPGAAPVPILLSDEIAAFFESGVSITVGVIGPDRRAETGRALAARVVAPDTVRLIFPKEGNAAVEASAKSAGPIAVTFSAPLSHRTIQIKGMVSRIEQIEPEDLCFTQRQVEAFAAILDAIGYTPAFVKAFCDYRPTMLFILSFPVHAAFEQTPGPGAGRAI